MITIDHYPTLAFAFNPILVYATTDRPTISFTANGHTITRPSRGAGVSNPIYIQAIAQSLFDVAGSDGAGFNQDLMKKMQFTVTDGSDIKSGSIDVVWGALQFGEIYTQNKTVTWFRGLPFGIMVYLNTPKKIWYQIDNGEILATPSFVWNTAGRKNLDPASVIIFPGIENAKHTLRILIGDGDVKEVVLVHIRDCTKGVYLRWINRYGEYSYYLFDEGSSSNTVSNGNVDINVLARTVDHSVSYYYGSNRPSEKNAQRSIRLFAPLVDAGTFDMLETLTESLVVDLYLGKNSFNNDHWVRVNIAPGTFSRSKSILQDFECNMLYPKTFNQSL